MATYHGKNGVVKIAANAVAEVTKFSVKTSAQVANDTAMGDDWETHVTGETVNSWSGSLSCNAYQGDTNGQAALVAGASVTLNLYPEGAATGANYLTGTATITEDSVDADKGAVVARSFSFQGNGPLAWATVAA